MFYVINLDFSKMYKLEKSLLIEVPASPLRQEQLIKASNVEKGHLYAPKVGLPFVDVPKVGLPVVDIPMIDVPMVDVPVVVEEEDDTLYCICRLDSFVNT